MASRITAGWARDEYRPFKILRDQVEGRRRRRLYAKQLRRGAALSPVFTEDAGHEEEHDRR